MAGKLYLVATPIGNLADVSARALETLAAASGIVCEDTRHSRVLLEHHGISRPLYSLPAFAEGERAGGLIDRIEAGEDLALVTDAGSPGISDPGEAMVAEAVARGIEVVPIPGPAAVIAALSASGLPTSRFHFLGFLPRKVSARREMLSEVKGLSATLVIYESPRRLGECLKELAEVLGDRRACVARELTKVHEEFVRGSLSQLADEFGKREVLGEIVVVVEGLRTGSRWTEDEVVRGLKDGLASGTKLKALAGEIARASEWSSQEVYRLGLKLKA